MTTTAQGTNEPLTYANAPRYVDENGVTHIELEASLTLARRIAVREKDLLDSLAKK